MALTDHVIVLAHLEPQVISAPPTQTYEDALRALAVPEAAIMALPEVHRQQRVGTAGEPKTTAAALDFRPSGIVVEVSWPCGCGAELHPHHDLVLGVWAKHVADHEGVPAELLVLHPVASIRAEADAGPVVTCLCGERFESEGYLPDAALRAWERHVRAA